MPFRRDAEGLNGVEKGKIPVLDITNLKATPKRHNKLISESKESNMSYFCVHGHMRMDQHLGHVAGCYLPEDIQYRFESCNKVLMVSGIESTQLLLQNKKKSHLKT